MERTTATAGRPDGSSAPLMPSDVGTRVGFFDTFAGMAANAASRAPFFAFCVSLVLLWLIRASCAS
jgi:hypothetical protein